jgi:hypothetical protein
VIFERGLLVCRKRSEVIDAVLVVNILSPTKERKQWNCMCKSHELKLLPYEHREIVLFSG